MQIVLFIQSSQRNNWQKKLSGAYRFAREHDWLLQVLPYTATPREVRQALEFWNPAGCMVDMVNSRKMPNRAFRNLPVAFLDPPYKGRRMHAPVLMHDSAATAQLAAEELLKSGFPDYAYIQYRDNPWNRARRDAFKAVIIKAGKRFHEASGEDARRFLSRLPKPCGILAGNDAAAAETIHTANLLGLQIPSQIAIVGIDNEELVCENENPTISSVEPDFEGAGYMLAQILAAEMDKKGSAPHVSLYSPLRLVKRGSTSMLPKDDPRVRRGIEFIRTKALSERITVDNVVSAMGCSRRLATMRFREATGRSICDEALNVRIEEAKRLLRDPWRTIDSIVDFSGYKSASYFKKAFKRKTGATMREWRRIHTD